jgi:hypothetical protein
MRCRKGFLEAKMPHKWFSAPIVILIFWVYPSVGGWAQSERVTAFVHVNLVPMTAEKIIPDQTVLIKREEGTGTLF